MASAEKAAALHEHVRRLFENRRLTEEDAMPYDAPSPWPPKKTSPPVRELDVVELLDEPGEVGVVVDLYGTDAVEVELTDGTTKAVPCNRVRVMK